MTDRILHHHVLGAGPILEKHLDGIGDRALVGLKIFPGETRVFDNHHLVAQHIDDRMRLVEFVLVILGHQIAEGQRHSSHVLDAVIAISGIG
ncbi:hypothetical protein D3C87_1633710 [compost metagenome]